MDKPDLSISQLSEHGEFRAQTRGVSIDDLQSTVENPLIVLRQSSGRFLYLSDKVVVVLGRDGAVVTPIQHQISTVGSERCWTTCINKAEDEP